jgi:hypothetical protein
MARLTGHQPFRAKPFRPEIEDDNMNHEYLDNINYEYLRDQIHRASNGRFYALCAGRAVCLSYGCLRYFETEQDGLKFLANVR